MMHLVWDAASSEKSGEVNGRDGTTRGKFERGSRGGRVYFVGSSGFMGNLNLAVMTIPVRDVAHDPSMWEVCDVGALRMRWS